MAGGMCLITGWTVRVEWCEYVNILNSWFLVNKLLFLNNSCLIFCIVKNLKLSIQVLGKQWKNIRKIVFQKWPTCHKLRSKIWGTVSFYAWHQPGIFSAHLGLLLRENPTSIDIENSPNFLQSECLSLGVHRKKNHIIFYMSFRRWNAMGKMGH